MADELNAPTGMNFSPLEPSSLGGATQQTAWDFEAGGSYQGQAHSENGHTSAEVNSEAHVHGDAWVCVSRRSGRRPRRHLRPAFVDSFHAAEHLARPCGVSTPTTHSRTRSTITATPDLIPVTILIATSRAGIAATLPTREDTRGS